MVHRVHWHNQYGLVEEYQMEHEQPVSTMPGSCLVPNDLISICAQICRKRRVWLASDPALEPRRTCEW